MQLATLTTPPAAPSTTDPALCRHCNAGPVCRPRSLCWSCYYQPGVRDLYPSTSKYGTRGVSNFGNRNAALPATPTDAPPGSHAKVSALMQRARQGESLWHPDDARR
jgi:hypothetical protein